MMMLIKKKPDVELKDHVFFYIPHHLGMV